MSISIDPMSAGRGLQHQNLKTTQPAADNSAPGAVFNARAASLPGSLSSTPAVKAAAEARDAVESEAKLNTEQTRQSLVEINKALTSMSVSVQFEIDPDYKDVIVKVVDQDSGKVVRQIPTEEVVRISKAMDNLKGLLFAQAV